MKPLLAAAARPVADSKGADLVGGALDAAPTAVGVVTEDIDADSVAGVRPISPTVCTRALAAVRGFAAAYITASATVVGIRGEVGARTIAAVGSACDAVVNTISGNARDVLVGPRRGTRGSAASAVQNVVFEIGAVAAAAGLSPG